jgi:GTP diphosphokinase / guanosine-3',5'-bis(diphosphate) 3'-diphosphatase
MDKIVIAALRFAAFKHRYQQRQSGDDQPIPYLNHPIEVMGILSEAGITDPNILSAALLHDTLEDTETTIDELTDAFGPIITGLVIEATDDQAPPRAERYAAQIAKVPSYSHDAKLIKIADRIANIRDSLVPPKTWSRERQLGHFAQSQTIVNLMRGTHAVLESMYDAAYQDAEKIIQN